MPKDEKLSKPDKPAKSTRIVDRMRDDALDGKLSGEDAVQLIFMVESMREENEWLRKRLSEMESKEGK